MKRQHESLEDSSTSEMPSDKRSKPSENNNIVAPSQLDDLALDDPVNEQISESAVEDVVEKLKKKKSEKKKEKIKALEHQIKEFEAKICHTENQNALLQRKFDNLSKLETQNAEYRKIIKSKEVSNSEQQRRHEKIYQQWEAQKHKFDLKLDQHKNEFRDTLRAKDDEIGGLKIELEEIRQEVLSKDNDNYQLNFEIENLMDELSNASDEIEKLKGKQIDADNHVDQSSVKNMENEAQIAQKEAQICKLRKELDAINNELTSSNAEKEKIEKEFAEYNIKLLLIIEICNCKKFSLPFPLRSEILLQVALKQLHHQQQQQQQQQQI